MPGGHSKISVSAFGECSHAAAANRVRYETSDDTPGDALVADWLGSHGGRLASRGGRAARPGHGSGTALAGGWPARLGLGAGRMNGE
jgi:hypothetical protein